MYYLFLFFLLLLLFVNLTSAELINKNNSEYSNEYFLYKNKIKYFVNEQSVNNEFKKSSDNYYLCLSRPCLPLCCNDNYKLFKNKCIPIDNNKTINFPDIYDDKNNIHYNFDDLNDYFYFIVRDPCKGGKKWRLNPEKKTIDKFKLLKNGSIYHIHNNDLFNFKNYCFGYINGNSYSVVLCFDDDDEKKKKNSDKFFDKNLKEILTPIGLFLSIPFLILTFMVYCILSELNNIHGKTIRVYIGNLIIAYGLLGCVQIIPGIYISDFICCVFGTFFKFKFE